MYVGNADARCNFIGNEAWVSKLEHKFHGELSETLPTKWTTLASGRRRAHDWQRDVCAIVRGGPCGTLLQARGHVGSIHEVDHGCAACVRRARGGSDQLGAPQCTMELNCLLDIILMVFLIVQRSINMLIYVDHAGLLPTLREHELSTFQVVGVIRWSRR
ncbi:hypothetical protein BC629DRAFT_555151 [Irpex lacteus]|nr:hypothetical protein BC629DRAFT_555151 [Irpex lacteus]